MMKLKMICNPYEKTINYLWYDEAEEKYIDISERAGYCPELTNAKFTRNVTIQSRADEIVKIIDDLDPGDLGIDVHFVGTQDDYDDLKRVVELFYETKNIHCIKDADYFNDAEFSLSEIQSRFSQVQEILAAYQEDDILKLLNSYEETMKPDLAICVMGLYSSGKSAFINSLVGCELLPSASDPTTAKVCKIQCRDSYRITVTVNQVPYTVSFSEDDTEISGDDPEIIELLRKYTADGNSRIERMYHLLKRLNTKYPFGKTYEDGPLIEVTLPYINSLLPTDKFDFVIYDTPGSNSASNREHFAVLNEALTAQTNALPIILTTPDSMDSTDNDVLLDLIHGYENKLDTTNGLIIVNKADDKGPRSLMQKRDKIDGLKLTKWKSTRIFFVSSILGLAGKKSHPHDESCWYDLDSFEIFEKNSSLYETGERKLYDFNIIDKSRVLDFDLSEKDGINTMLLYNSGLASIELEIANFAKRYAQYLKCREAIKYLKKASTICSDNVREMETAQISELTEATSRFEKKKLLVLDAMDVQRVAVIKKADEMFRLEISKIYAEFKAKHRIYTAFGSRSNSYIYADFQEEWESIRNEARNKKASEEQALQWMQEYVTEQMNELLLLMSTETNCEIEAFWETRMGVFKKILRRIITDSKKLTPEQKQILDEIVLDMNAMTKERVEFDLRTHKGVRMGIIPFIPLGKESYNNSGCCRNFLAEFDRLVKSRIETVRSRNLELYNAWCLQIIDAVSEKITTFNDELREAKQRIAALQSDIDEKKKHADLLEETTEYIESLMKVQKTKTDSES